MKWFCTGCQVVTPTLKRGDSLDRPGCQKMHHGVTPLSPNPSLPDQTQRLLPVFSQKRERLYEMGVDWNRVRRVDSSLSEDEKEAVLERLNELVAKYRSINADYWSDEEDD